MFQRCVLFSSSGWWVSLAPVVGSALCELYANWRKVRLDSFHSCLLSHQRATSSPLFLPSLWFFCWVTPYWSGPSRSHSLFLVGLFLLASFFSWPFNFQFPQSSFQPWRWRPLESLEILVSYLQVHMGLLPRRRSLMY